MPKTMPTSGSTALVCIPASQGSLVAMQREQSGAVSLFATWARMVEMIDRAEQTRSPGVLAQYVAAVWSRLLAWRMRRATRIILHALDDRMLRDIGLERSEIEFALRDPRRQALRGHI
jgi:uncharacterized protein YjiS (DUF1127 family)